MKLATYLALLGFSKASICGLTESGPTKSTADNQIIENLYILALPTDETALRITHENVTVSNVVIHHPASTRGLFGWKPHGLKIENLEVIAYGVHESGPTPCPTRAPFKGYNCNNVIIYKADNVVVENLRVEGGSKGLSFQECDGALVTNVTVKNVRGPNPGGQCLQIARSDDVTIDGFHCLMEDGSSWTGDTISSWRASRTTLKNGIVDGNNSDRGICVMYEGSSIETEGGLVENVDAIHCQGCFSGYPSTGLEMKNVTCAQSWCDGTERFPAKKDGAFNLWQYGPNLVEPVYSYNNTVADSFYENNCPSTKVHHVYGGGDSVGEDYSLISFEATEITNGTYTIPTPMTITFDWDTCADLTVPTTKCEEFPRQRLGKYGERTNIHTGISFCEVLWGQCQPDESNPMHPDELEQEWVTDEQEFVPLDADLDYWTYCQLECYGNGECTKSDGSYGYDEDDSEGMSLIDQIIEYFEDDQGLALGISVCSLAFNLLYL